MREAWGYRKMRIVYGKWLTLPWPKAEKISQWKRSFQMALVPTTGARFALPSSV
jgi:hypothetical protein